LSSGQYIVGYLHAYVAESFQTVGFFIEIGGVAVNGSIAVRENDISLEAIYSGTPDSFDGIVVGLLELYFGLSPAGGG
jgi:phage head maturation protease